MKILLCVLVSMTSSCSTRKRSLSSPLRLSSLSKDVKLPAFVCCTATLHDSRHYSKFAYTYNHFAAHGPSFLWFQAGTLASTTLSGTDISCSRHFATYSRVSSFQLVWSQLCSKDHKSSFNFQPTYFWVDYSHAWCWHYFPSKVPFTPNLLCSTQSFLFVYSVQHLNPFRYWGDPAIFFPVVYLNCLSYFLPFWFWHHLFAYDWHLSYA